MSLLENKVALVTGAGSGIGKQVALKYAVEGAKVIVSDITEKGGMETVDEIIKAGGEAFFVKSNTAIPGDSENLVNQAVEKYGALHIAANIAGILGKAFSIPDYPIDEWDKVISINLSGIFYGMRYQLPAILKSGGGSIVNMSSMMGKVSLPNSSAYAASKHGVIGLTESAALEYSARGIRVNAVGPGFIKTPMTEFMDEPTRASMVALHPIGRLGEASEVAELVLWLSSEKASFVTGAFYSVDGGYLAQ